MSEFHDLVSDEPITDGVFLRRYPDGVESNVPHRVAHHSPSGYEWGYGGSGPADLALNIIEAALVAMGHNGRRVDCWRGDCFRLSWALHQNFKRKFLEGLPRDGGVIYWPALHTWILDQAFTEGLCVGCGEPTDTELTLSPEDYGLTEQDGWICQVCGSWRPTEEP